MGRKGFPSDKQDQYMLRFPDGMRDELKRLAAENNRSMNAEIISRLEATLLDTNRRRRRSHGLATLGRPTGQKMLDFGLEPEDMTDEERDNARREQQESARRMLNRIAHMLAEGGVLPPQPESGDSSSTDLPDDQPKLHTPKPPSSD